jgi:hypothetical protein
MLNPLNTELNPICHLLALLGAHPILHVSRVMVNSEIPLKWECLHSTLLYSANKNSKNNEAEEVVLTI